MEEPKDNTSGEIDLSDSWTVVNNDDSEEGNVSPEIGETSDSESLEVLEVEQAELDQNLTLEDQENHEIEGEENSCDEECTIQDCNDSFIFEDPIIHIAAVEKVRKYVHHPSAYINMWLSVVMVVAIAVTLGLGIGHYLGSKRFARAKDMIHHLQYENHMLEQELADVALKARFCKNDPENRGNIFSSPVHDYDDVCYAEENPLNSNKFKDHLMNETFLPWVAYINVEGEHYPLYYIDNILFPNRSSVSTTNEGVNAKGDASFNVYSSFPKLEETFDKIISTKNNLHFSKLSRRVTYLNSLLRKWHAFHKKVKSQVSSNKVESNVEETVGLNRIPLRVVPVVSGNSDKILSENVKNTAAVSYNDFCRSKVKQCILKEEKFRNKAKKCRAMPKAQLLCSLLFKSKSKPGKIFLERKHKAFENKSWKSEIPKHISKEKKKAEEQKFVHKRAKDNFDLKFKKPLQRYSKDGEKINKKYKYSVTETKRWGKGGAKRKFFFEEGKENYKGKYQKRKENERETKRRTESHEKPSFNNFLSKKKEHFKPVKKEYKQYKKYDSKEFAKNKERHQTTSKENSYYSKDSKYKSLNSNKNCQKYHEKRFCNFPVCSKKFAGNHSKFSYTEYSYSCKTKSNNNNVSENAFLKYPSRNYQKDKHLMKYWKEKNKVYQLSIQNMKILKS